KAMPHPRATHCIQNRSGEKRRLRAAQTSRPEIITSAWMVSRVRWCSRMRNPLPGIGSVLPRKRDDRVPPGELVGPGVEQEDGEQRPDFAASAQVTTEPVEQRQGGRTF